MQKPARKIMSQQLAKSITTTYQRALACEQLMLEMSILDPEAMLAWRYWRYLREAMEQLLTNYIALQIRHGLDDLCAERQRLTNFA